jgi:hypothetical protein
MALALTSGHDAVEARVLAVPALLAELALLDLAVDGGDWLSPPI